MMSSPIHYCFDLWNTLIKENADFKKKRACFFYENLNYDAKSLEEVELIFNDTDQMCHAIAEKTGKTVDADQMYLMVISRMNNYCFPVSKIDLDTILKAIDSLLYSHMPRLESLETLQVLSQLKRSKNVTTSIVSNTGFLRGHTLRNVVTLLGLSQFIDWQLYSDEAHMSRSNPQLSQLLLQTINQNLPGSHLASGDIIYVHNRRVPESCQGNNIGFKKLPVDFDAFACFSMAS